MGKPETFRETKISSEEWEKRLATVRVQKDEMNQLVMNFFVTEGYIEAARMLQAESGTDPQMDLELIRERMDIRRALQSGDVEKAIDMVNDLNPEILEERHALAFHLQLQRLIELIRQDKTDEALEFAQEFLAPQGEEDPALLEELERAITLLAFDNKSESPLSGLLDAAQRQKTATELNAAILCSQCQPELTEELQTFANEFISPSFPQPPSGPPRGLFLRSPVVGSQSCIVNCSQDEEARLPGLLRMLIWAQKQLDHQNVVYPRITDILSGELTSSGA